MRLYHSLLFTLLAACGQSPVPNTPPAPAAPPTGLHFEFSTARASRDDEAGNHCHKPLSAGLAIYPDPANSNRRYFALEDGAMHRVAVDLGTTTASFFMRKKSDTVLELFTSDQLPECTSNRVNFTLLQAGGAGFRYDNHHHIDFNISAEQVGTVLRIWIEMPPAAGYGLSVRKSEER